MARVKYYDSTTQTWKYADMALQTGIHVGTTAPTNEAMLWVDTASNQIDSFPLTDVQDSEGNSLIVNQIAVIPSMPSGTNTGDILVWDGDEWVSKTIIQEVASLSNTSPYRCIVTDIKRNGATKFRIDLDFKVDDAAFNKNFILSIGRCNASGNGIGFGIWENNFCFFKPGADVGSISAVDTNRKTVSIQFNNDSVTISGGLSYSSSYAGWSSSAAWNDLPLTLWSADPQYPSVLGTIYSCKVYSEDVLVADLAPAYNSFAGTFGYFDNETGKYYSMI